MSGKKKQKKNKPRRRIGAIIAAVLLLTGAVGVASLHLNANIVHVRRAEVQLADLPASLDGTTLLFLTDFDLCGTNTARRMAKVLDRLQALQPDALLLGGDFTSASVFDRLNGKSAESLKNQPVLVRALAKFQAPMGKFAVTGDNDGATESLMLALDGTGVQMIDGTAAILTNGTDAFAIAGVGARTEDLNALTSKFYNRQCVVALAHSPDQITDIRIAEAKDGGAWADLVLCGHTHGGQVRIAGRSALSLTETEKRYLSGWYQDASAPLLVSQGLGCEGLNLRLGTQSEVWLLTLRRASNAHGMQFSMR